MKKVITLFLLCLSFLTFSGFGCKNDKKVEKIKASLPNITLNYWRIMDDGKDFSALIEAYNANHPYVTINYRKISLNEYKQELINAWSEDKGPDIFSIPATWMGEYISKNRLVPMPSSTTMTFEVVTNEKKGTVDYVTKTNKSLTLSDLKNKYVSVVYGDVVKNNSIYGLPLSVDTIALYYNRDLLDNARISEPAVTWSQFKEDVKKMTLVDKKGNIIQSGTSLGLVDNVNRSFDIASLLMMQNGSSMSCGDTFCVGGSTKDGYNPGMEALRFYSDFANPVSDVYSWNSNMENSIDAFAAGKVAYMFGYNYNKEQVKAKNPSLNYYITTVPQIDGSSSEINYANYFVEVVASKSQHQNEAWDFVKYITAAENVEKYLNATGKPAAIRSILSRQQDNPDVSMFARQAYTARDWYHGKDYAKAESVLNRLVSGVLDEMVEKSEEADLSKLEQEANEELNMTW